MAFLTVVHSESGSAVISSGGGSDQNDSVALGTNVDETNSILLYTCRGGDNTPHASSISGKLYDNGGTSTVYFDRPSSDTLEVNIEWQVIEFNDDVTVQHFDRTDSNDFDITAIDQDYSIIIGNYSVSGSTWGFDDDAGLSFVDDDTVGVDGSASSPLLMGYVVEFPSAAITSVTYYSAGSLSPGSHDVTLSPEVTVANALAVGSGQPQGNQHTHDWYGFEITATDNLNILSFQSGAGANTQCYMFVIDFADYTVEHFDSGSISGATDSNFVLAATPNDPALFMNNIFSNSRGPADDADDDYRESMWEASYSTDTITFTRDASNVNARIYASHIDFGESSGTEISATTDALILTEKAASVALDVTISAGVDALTITEQSATIGFDVNVSATTDVLTLTENSASIGVGVSVSASTDTLTLTENAAAISFDVGVTATTDSLTLTENAATVSLDANIAASVDALTLTENATTITHDREVTASTDALTVTEHTASVALGINVAASVDALTLTENQASIVFDKNVSASTDALTITGQSASISLDRNIAASVDTLTLTENSASIALGVVISASTDALTLTENNATVTYDVTVNATSDALTLTEYSASISGGSDIAATTDALTLTEYAASVSIDRTVSAASDALTLTEYAATVGIDRQVSASTDALTLTEYAASIAYDVEVAASTDSLILTEYPAALGTVTSSPDSRTVTAEGIRIVTTETDRTVTTSGSRTITH